MDLAQAFLGEVKTCSLPNEAQEGNGERGRNPCLGQEAWLLLQGPLPQEATVLASKNRQQSKSLALGPN